MPALLLAGHGPVGGKQSRTAYRDMLVEIAGRVEAMIAEGRTLGEVQAASGSRQA